LEKITEFCGIPGIGKTQMGMQLAVNVHLPEVFGGVGGHAIYIDTEGSFVPERVEEMAQAMTSHIKRTSIGTKEVQEIAEQFNPSDILSNIHCFRIHTYIEQMALVYSLPQLLSEKEKFGNVKLIVFDSVSFPFRHHLDFSTRGRLLQCFAQSLMSIAMNYNLAVVLTNQMTTKINDNMSTLVPALGDTWGHASTNKIFLFWKDGMRFAHLYKSPSHKPMTVPYLVTSQGIRSASI